MVKIRNKISNLAEIYKDFAELIEYKNVVILLHYMGGQQVTYLKSYTPKNTLIVKFADYITETI